MSKARHINVGNVNEGRAIVDKYKTTGRVFTKKEIIEAQLRGEIFLDGEYYGKSLEKKMAQQKPTE